MSFPVLPPELRDLEAHFTVAELKSIWYSVVEEVTLGPLALRTHGMKLYNTGCHGPICRRANRVAARIRNKAEPRKGAKELDQVISYFAEVALERRDTYSATLQEDLCRNVLDL